MSVSQAHLAGEYGFSVCSRGEEEIYNCLLDCKRRFSDASKGYFSDLKYFYVWIDRLANNDRAAQLRDIVRRFIFENYPIAKGEIVLDHPCPQRYFHSWTSAAEEFNINYCRAYSLRNAVAKPEHRHSFPVGNYEQEFLLLSANVHATHAAAYLDISPSILEKIEQLKLITPRLNLAKMRKIYAYDDLDQFMEKLKAHAKPLPEAHDHLTSIKKLALCNKASICETLMNILEGSIKQVYFSSASKGISAIWVDASEVEALYLAEHEKLYDCFSRGEIKHILRVSHSTVSYLCNNGFLKSFYARQPRTNNWTKPVERKELDSFLSKYITGGILCHNTNMQGNQMVAYLKKLNVHPVGTPTGINKIFLRSEIPDELL